MRNEGNRDIRVIGFRSDGNGKRRYGVVRGEGRVCGKLGSCENGERRVIGGLGNDGNGR